MSKHCLPLLVLLLCSISNFIYLLTNAEEEDLLLLTVATNETDGFQRYLRSARVFDLNGKVLGMGEKWLGGDMNYPGGGFKVNLLKQEMEEHKDKDNLIVLFSDSYDVILTSPAADILSKFHSSPSLGTARIVFSAEGFCWPDASLEAKYPAVDNKEARFLNSGGFIGYAKDVYEMLQSADLTNTDDDQLFYTKIFLDEETREKYKIKLDHKSEIFQNLNGAVADVEMSFETDEPFLKNTVHDTRPAVIHGNGPSKLVLNSLGNYLAKSWNKEDQCTACWEDNLDLKKQSAEEVPQVVLGIFIEQPTPFIDEFFQNIMALDYPRDKMDVLIHNAQEYHEKDVEKFVRLAGGDLDDEKDEDDKDEDKPKYHSVTVLGPTDDVKEWQARQRGVDKCVETKCDYYFSVDAVAHLDNKNTLTLLMEQNRKVLAPLMIRPFKAWSNFWGALTSDGFYARSSDYMELVQNNRRGLWNVPYLNSCYLILGTLIHDPETRPSFVHKTLDPDMAFCQNLRDKDIFIYVTNRLEWGHLINDEDFDTSHLNNELWEISSNQWDWEQRYLHENYSESLEEDAEIAQPCPDVYWFPIMTDRFADELVAEMEHFGKWSNGTSDDNRLEGGYENVPTRDIHMNQIGFEREWLTFLDRYVRHLQEAVFDGYIHSPPRSIMNFVVRYRPDEQPSLRPHHDSSTYTINIALNQVGKDYEGGGCNFLRYDCSVPGTKKGWMLMHPGRLTHYHEGLTTTKGTRYIMISFVDP